MFIKGQDVSALVLIDGVLFSSISNVFQTFTAMHVIDFVEAERIGKKATDIDNVFRNTEGSFQVLLEKLDEWRDFVEATTNIAQGRTPDVIVNFSGIVEAPDGQSQIFTCEDCKTSSITVLDAQSRTQNLQSPVTFKSSNQIDIKDI